MILDSILASIGPASPAHGEAARARVAGAGAPILERLAAALGAAQHDPRPRARPRTLVIVAGDHGAGDPGVALGASHPTAAAARAIADGTAAVCDVARTAATPIVLVDAGSREPAHMPPAAIRLGAAPGNDLFAGPALDAEAVTALVEAGIALAITLATPSNSTPADPDPRPAALALGALGLGAELSAIALYAAATGRGPTLDDPDAERAVALGVALASAPPLARLAALGGPETCVLAGVIVGAASIDVPVILDSYATGAAALAAAALAPLAAGYLIGAHRGDPVHAAILAHLGLVPLYEAGLGHGDGAGAAIALPLLDQVAALAARR